LRQVLQANKPGKQTGKQTGKQRKQSKSGMTRSQPVNQPATWLHTNQSNILASTTTYHSPPNVQPNQPTINFKIDKSSKQSSNQAINQ
jgi:hypothetical protein